MRLFFKCKKLYFFLLLPEYPVFSPRYKVKRMKNNFRHYNLVKTCLLKAKAIFSLFDFVAGSKNGVFRYIKKINEFTKSKNDNEPHSKNSQSFKIISIYSNRGSFFLCFFLAIFEKIELFFL
jgi:hypothetical protein